MRRYLVLLKAEPHGEQFPNLLPLSRRPILQRQRATLALRKLCALQLAQLFRYIQWVHAPPLPIKKIMLRGEVHKLLEVFAACGC